MTDGYAAGGWTPGPPIQWVGADGRDYVVPIEVAINFGMKYLEDMSRLNVQEEDDD